MRTIKILLSIIFWAIVASLIAQAIFLFSAEVAEQEAAYGHYDKNVIMNYGRYVAKNLCIILAIVGVVPSISFTIYAIKP